MCFPRLQYAEPVAVSAMASNGNWTEPTGGVFAKYQVSSFTPSRSNSFDPPTSRMMLTLNSFHLFFAFMPTCLI